MAFANSGAQVQTGPEIAFIETEGLGFAGLKGDKKLKLLPSPWPEDNLPPPTSSLLSVASKTGILAAAGPNALIIATTASVRQGFSGDAPENKGVKDFIPQVTLQTPPLSQVAFSSNETFLVISAQQGGGLAVYEVAKLQQPNPQPAFQIPTNGTSVRALIPNPEFDDLFSIVLTDGTLLLAHLTERKLVNGPTGSTVLQQNVSSVSWSARGKQLVAGLGDGTAVQIKQDGSIVAQIPRPPEIEADQHTASIYWLANDEFLVTHCPTQRPEDIPPPTHHFITTDKGRSTFQFSKISDEPCFPSMDSKRSYPYHYFLARLRRWDALNDLLILVSTDSIDVGTITKSSKPLAPQGAVDEYTVVTLDDSRRAAVPPELLSANGQSGGMASDSTAIGIALDLSATEKILRPIPKEEEIEESPTPLPAFMILNHEGVLCAWWIVYNESIKGNTGYPGLVALSDGAVSATPAAASATAALTLPAQELAKPAPQNSGFGSFAKPTVPGTGFSGFSNASGGAGFGKPAFGTPSAPGAGAFGQPAFGTTSAPGGATFGQPAFGTLKPLGSAAAPSSFGNHSFGPAAAPAFGATGGIGNRASLWAAATKSPPKSETQQSPFSSFSGGGSGFAKFGASTPVQSPFGAASNTASGFAGLAQSKPGSFFGQKSEPTSFVGTSKDSFGSTVTIGSSFGGTNTPSSWAQTPAQPSSLFGAAQTSSFASSTKESDMGDSDDAQNRERDEATPTPQPPPPENPQGLFSGSGFKLGSSFKGDGSAKDDLSKPPQPSTSSLFGKSFLSGVNDAPKEPATPVKDEPVNSPRLSDISTTPAAPPKFQSVNQPSLFGGLASTTPSHTPAKEPAKEAQTPVAPSPPESLVGEDAPLPPDPTTFKPTESHSDDLPPIAGSPAIKVEAPDSSPVSSPGLSSHGDDFSVEEQDETEGGQPASDQAQRPTVQGPTWSFGLSTGSAQSPRIPPQAPTPPVGAKSGTSSRPRNQSRSPSRSPTRSLFQASSTPAGNPFASKQAPIFPAPSQPQDSLRSPSPVRSASTSAVGRRHKSTTASPFAPAESFESKPHSTPAPVPAVSDLSDDENDRIRQELQSDVRPNRRLDPFVAHQNYTGGAANKSGVPAQIEIIYRDINSMIDTLGINARSLASFVKYHAESSRGREITREDLDEALDQGEEGDWNEEWCLAELDELIVLENELGHVLDSGRLTQVHEKLLQLAVLSQDVHKLRSRVADIKLQIQARNDPASLERLRLQPLSANVAKMQRELRDSFAGLLKRLATAEEEVVLLRTKIAGASTGGRTRTQVPTVEAVTKTIEKMTAMVTKKSGDIDVLENTLKKLNIRDSSETSELGASRKGRMRESSPFATPPRSKALVVGGQSTGRTYGLFDTPDSTPSRNGKGKETGANGEAVKVFNEKKATRKKLGALLTGAVLERGTKVTGIGV